MQCLEREGRVAYPRVAVVPVAVAPGGLGQRGGKSRHGRPRGHVREALDRQGGALEGVPVGMVDGPRPRQPGPPEARGRGQGFVGLVDVARCGQAGGPRQRAVHVVAGSEDVSGPNPATLDAERHVGVQPDRLVRACGVGDVTAPVRERPRRLGAAVIEHRLADDLDLDLTVDACSRPHQGVCGVIVRGRPGVRRDLVLALTRSHGQRVADNDPAARGVPRRGEDVGPGLVLPRRRDVDAERPQPEVPRLAVKQGAEHTGRVEARHAQPADSSVRSNQRTRVAIGQEPVILDRRERRGHRRALLTRRTCSNAAHDASRWSR